MTTKTLRDYQLVDLTFYMMNERCANLSDPGTGKTPPTCVYMDHLWTDKGVRSFWVMPKSLLKKNRDELLEFTRFTEDDLLIYDGTPAQREKLKDTSDAKVWLMGFRRFADEWKDLIRLHEDFDALIVDEIHMGFGGHSSGQTNAMYRAMKFLKYFVPMTGTLINGRLDTAYPTIHVIEPRYYGSYQRFLDQHEIRDWLGKRVGWKGHEKIARIFARHTIKRSFSDVYGTNEIVTQVEKVPMSPRQRKVYDAFESKAILNLGDRFMISDGVAAVETIRLRQIMGHPEDVSLPVDWDEDGKAIAWKSYNLLGKGEHTGKDERLLIHLEDHRNTGKPLLIYAAFKKEIERMVTLCQSEGFAVGMIHGGVSTNRRAAIDEDFRSGAIDIVVASPETAAVGYNWGHVDHIVFASIDYKDSNYIQARRRAERGVRERPLRVTVLEYEKSVDQKIFEIVQKKSESARLVDPTLTKVSLVEAAPPPPAAVSLTQAEHDEAIKSIVHGFSLRGF